jgi:[acyl-carrier-protein] S-malonyltransferase
MGRRRLEVGELMRIGVVFPGQGSQVVGMGVDAARTYPAAAECFEQAKTVLGYDLLRLCETGPEEKLRETRYAQPAIFVTNVALAMAIGDRLSPVVSAGHSFGEFCSLTLAGSLTFTEALALVNERGLAMHRAAEKQAGAMSAILAIDPQRLREIVKQTQDDGVGRVQLANFNAPGQIVISGDVDAVRIAGERALEAGAKRVVPLNVAGAWHSILMAPARKEFEKFIKSAPLTLPSFTVISNVDARAYEDVATIRENLIRSVTDEVIWHDVAQALAGYELDLIVEFGASPVLAPMMKRIEGAPKAMSVADSAGVAKLIAQLDTDLV